MFGRMTWVVLAVIATGCAPQPPEEPISSEMISDQVHHQGTTGFFFLPPIAPLTKYRHDVATGLSPVVTIEEIGGRGTIATFTRTSHPPVIELFRAYGTVWDPRASGVKKGFIYRIHVVVDNAELGFAEARVATMPAEVIADYRHEYVPLVGLPLLIAFRIEPAAVACVGVTCAASDACHLPGTCDPATGTCSNPPVPDGTACDDDDACTQLDVCAAGVCIGANPVVCTPADACHLGGACDPTTGTCANPAAPDGTACDDGDPSTTSDACVAGACIGLSTARLVTVAGDLQSELGCPDDWMPDCAASGLPYDAGDEIWEASFALPAGSYQYKVTLDNSWTTNYGANAVLGGNNISLPLAAPATVKFYYDDRTHWIADSHTKVIATAAGSFQALLGCPGDWQPDCLRSWLEDPDSDGIYQFTTTRLRVGSYETKVAIAESWSENYGVGGVPGGPNIPFTVPADCAATQFSYDAATHVLAIGAAPAHHPSTVTLAGSLESEVGCTDDWQPDCTNAHLVFDANDGIWQSTFAVPAGDWAYKVAIDNSWNENYGANAVLGGNNISLPLAAPATVKFYYDDRTHWIADNHTKVIATAAGSFQAQLGCPGDWQPDCLRSWLEDPDGDGIYKFSAHLPAGSYEAKVAINESWLENYGAGGTPGGANIPFTVPFACADVSFVYDSTTHVLTVTTP